MMILSGSAFGGTHMVTITTTARVMGIETATARNPNRSIIELATFWNRQTRAADC